MLDALVVEATLAVLQVLSVVTWGFALWKWRANRKSSRHIAAFEASFWSSQSWAEAKIKAEESSGELADIARTGFNAYAAFDQGPANLRQMLDPMDAIERPMQVALQQVLRKQERGQTELATIGATAPFIGLFGTVWGIMGALKAIGLSGQASIDVVAGPVGEALIATAVGIATAIPAVLLYNYFLRAQKLRVTQMDAFIEAFARMAARQLASEDRRP